MKEQTKEKINNIVWPLVYFVLAIVLSISIAVAAGKTGFTRIFVSGQSMEPTLHGGSAGGAQEGDVVDFGYMDPSSQAIDNLKRFNIITTYFPYEWGINADYDATGKLKDNASYKIKRVIGFPGEKVHVHIDSDKTCHITITKDKNKTDYVYSDIDKGWKTTIDQKEHFYKFEINHKNTDKQVETELKENEYFVMGDNWDVSDDSSKHYLNGNLKKDNLQGVLIAIEGTAKIVIDSKTGKKTVDNLNYSPSPTYYYREL